MLHRLLNRHEEKLLQAERGLLQTLNLSLARLDAEAEDQARLAQALRQLDELFLLVIVGEFNAGKSAFINALLGQKLLTEGVTPTTTRVHVLRHGDEVTRTLTEADLEVITSPVDWLQEINIVDTPGTNAVIQRHQEISEDFVPRSDLVLFVTSADRPFSESERLFLERIRKWGKKVVIVVNKVDILDENDVPKVRDFVTENAIQLLGVQPEVFLVSARLAQRAKRANQRIGESANGAGQIEIGNRQSIDPQLWAASRFEPLERYILQTLDERERLRLKLLSPLGVAGRLHEQYAELTQARLELLTEDFATIDTVETDLRAYEEDMRRDFRYHLSHIENTLHLMSDRGMKFFDETLRISRVFDLMNSARVKQAFEEDVVAGTVAEIQRHIDELIDWMVERDYKQWQAVMGYLNRRAERHSDRVIGQVGGAFELNRQELLDSVGRAAQRVVDTYDEKAEAAELAESVQLALAQTAIMEVSAVGLGAILVVLLHTVIADVTGLLAASTLAAVGLYVLPNRRKKAREELRTKIAALREELDAALTRQFEAELANSMQRIREAVAPYTRFVRSERQKLNSIEQDLEDAAQRMRDLRARIKAL